jgi:hypothetical protein
LSIRIQPKETFFLLKSKSLFTTPTKGAVNCGQGMTIFAKRPTPSALGKKLLYAFGEEYPTNQNADQQDRLCRAIYLDCFRVY